MVWYGDDSRSKNSSRLHPGRGLVFLLLALICCSAAFAAKQPGWERKQVDWRITGGRRIKAVSYPRQKPLPMLKEHQTTTPRKKLFPPEAVTRMIVPSGEPISPIVAIVFDSPPIDGFVPWVAVSVTHAHEMEYELNAIAETSIVGSYFTSYPESDYAMGILDTGASASLMNAFDAYLTGLYDAGEVTSATVTLTGATGSVDAFVSHPLGLFIDGLGAIEPNGLLIDTSEMVGTSNVSIIVGDPIASPNLPTAIGSPWAVFFAADFRNDHQTTITYNSEDFTAPDILFYGLSEDDIPSYSNKMYLELRPSLVSYVQYFPCIEPIWECPDGDGSPLYPTMIIDGSWSYQGLFFASSVDLTEGSKSAIDKDGFMFDTGAQVTVIGEAIAARLRLNPTNPDFTAEIEGVTGDIIIAPGFYIDLLEITTAPEWLSFTNVPAVMLDVASPEGGVLDGIIGMNLFVDLNFVFHGGGLPGQASPFLEFEPVPYHIIADIAPRGGDGVVDFLDLAALADAWLATSTSANWDAKCDIAPSSEPDGKIDLLDFSILADHWFESATP